MRSILTSLVAALAAALLTPPTRADETADVVVYGGTPAGIAAALAAEKDGRSVLLVEPTDRLGGLVTSGLSHTDFRTFEGLTGTYLDFSKRVAAEYVEKYGPDSPQAKGNFRGTHAEPKVNLAVFEEMLAERRGVRVVRSRRLVEASTETADGLARIRSVTLSDPNGKRTTVEGKVFIDATYEGDLMAAAKVTYRVGREGRDEHGESLAPEKADGQLQGYNFRLVMTEAESNRAGVRAPDGYRREDFVEILPLLKSQKLVRVFGKEGEAVVFKVQYPLLPNGKADINDVSRGLVRLSLPSENLKWPDGDERTRRAIFDEHRRWNLGLLHFLRTDGAVPEAYRRDANKWGPCKDEFAETDHLPPQLYVREARRMQGLHVFRQRDCEHAEGDARAVPHRDSVAVGDYGPNCHGTAHEGSRFGGKHTGEFYHPVPPYQIPYGVLVPKEVSNLLVPVAASSSHVGFCALRLEPIWVSLGQASGHAAHLGVESGKPLRSIDVAKLQSRLHAVGSATVYVSDVPPGHPRFAAVQWWGTAGGLHGEFPAPEKPGQRGERIVGQYFQAFPNHAFRPDVALTPPVLERWEKLAGELKIPVEKLPRGAKTTRGEWLRAAFAARP